MKTSQEETTATSDQPGDAVEEVVESPDQQEASDVGGKKPIPAAGDERPLGSLSLEERAEMFDSAPDMIIDPEGVYVATIETAKGDIVVEMYSQEAPQSVNNFVVLANLGFFDGMNWHQVPQPDQHFAVLSGDPLDNGESGPGYTIPAEILVPHRAGAMGWARLPDQSNPGMDSNGSTFYITNQETPFLDGGYSVFGQVIEGLEVVDQIVEGDKIIQVSIDQADERKAPTPPPPTATPEPLSPVLDPDGGRPLAEIPPEQRQGIFNAPPAMQLEPGVDYLARITTEKGDILVDLHEEQVPNTVNNFVVLADLGFYDNTTFHRVIEEFMAQAGDPTGTGSGGAGYRFSDEFVPELTHDSAGLLSMANAGPNTNGTQFFITLAETPWLDGKHTVFGKVIEGMEVVDSISLRDPQAASKPGDLIKSITIETR
ncbi:MAG: peptidylprolyl isomerase [Chloroflexota bacterium]|nr:peptidylprolyl isomerase [Chloroflexota bacterium]